MRNINGDMLKKMLRDADKGGYAVPAFNYTDLWDLSAIVEAAQELAAPVMFASIPKVVNELSPQICGAVGREVMKKAGCDVIHHLDHSNSVELCRLAIENGYPSVMIDASKDSLEENIRKVRAVVESAHPAGVHVEAEIGRIKGRDYEGTYLGDDYLVNVDEAAELVEKTGVDSLAVGIGTAHGFYEGKPEINFKRLQEVNEAIDIPLVLHGGTGIPEEDVRRAIKSGINKVNIGTQIRFTYLSAVLREISLKGPATHTIEIMHEAKKAVAEEVKAWIRVCMAEGRRTAC